MQRKGFDGSSKSKLPRRTFLIVSAAAIIVLALLADVKPAIAAPTITANPNPVLIAQGKNEGTTMLSWDAGVDRSDSRVWLQVDGDREELFAASAKGTSEIKVVIDKTYTFRLYSGDGAQVLASIVVKGKRANPSLPEIPRSASAAQPAYIYGVLPDGTLRWFRHDGRGRGTSDWQGPRDITSGLNGLRQAFAAGPFLFYTVSAEGTLKRYYHSSTDQALDLPTMGTEVPRAVGNGWQNFKHVFSAGEGTIYAVAQDGRLKWYRLEAGFANPKDVSSGWGDYRSVFSTGGGVIYAITQEGKLLWHKHNFYKYGVGPEGHGPLGEPAWEGPKAVGTGWQNFRQVFSPGEGVIYAVTKEGNLLWYRHQGYRNGANLWLGPNEISRGGWSNFEHAFALLPDASSLSNDRKTSSELKVIPPVFSTPAESSSYFRELIIQPTSDGAIISFNTAGKYPNAPNEDYTMIAVGTTRPFPLPEKAPYDPVKNTYPFPREANQGYYCNEVIPPTKRSLGRRDCRVGGLTPGTLYYFVIKALTLTATEEEWDKEYTYSGTFKTKSADTLRPRKPQE